MTDKLPKRAQRSLLKLASLMGNEILSLPIEVYDDSEYPWPAYTDSNAVHVGKSILEHEPQNLCTYVGHEILHHVLEDEFVRSMFDPEIVNRGSDHVINHVLKAIYGLDVRKVKHVGLYDKSYRGKTVYQVCVALSVANECAVNACGYRHRVTNPIIYDVALKIRARLAEHSTLKHLELGKVRELVLLSESQGQELFDELKAKYWRNSYRQMRDVNYDQLVRSMFGRLFASTVRYDVRKDMPVLSHSHGIALSIKTEKLRQMSVGDAAMSLSFANQFTTDLSFYGTDSWKQSKISRITSRIESLRRKIGDKARYSRQERSRFKMSIGRALEKIAVLESVTPLDDILTVENRIRVRSRNDQATGFMLRDALTIKEDHLPRMRVNDVVRMVRKITKSSIRACKELYSLKSDLESYVRHQKHSAIKTIEEKSENRHKDEDHSERQKIPRASKTKQSQSLNPDQGESTTVSLDAGASAGDGAGSGEGSSSAAIDMRMLNAISLNRRLLKKILIEADMFREKLSNVSRSHVDDNALVDRSYTFGNEIQKADTSALAKMVGKMTKLAFYADVANHALLQNVGTQPRRGSVIIAIDCSGSMSGDRYTIAAGFATAMFNVMSDIGRGCALVKFSSTIDGVYVCDIGQPVDLLTLVESLTNPSYGGTDFDVAFSQSLAIAETLSWKNTQMILVTDGKGTVSPSILESVYKAMRVTAIVVGKGSVAISGIGDTRHIRSLDDLRNGLLDIGRAVC